MGFLDDVVGFFSPKAAYQRMSYKMAMDVMRKYEAASGGRRGKNRYAPDTSADSEVEIDLRRLRNLSRDMTRNNPFAKRAVRMIANNVVGAGIRPSTYAQGRAGKRIKEEWRRWAERTKCDYDGMRNFYGLQRKVMKAVAESGECLVVRRRVSDPLMPIPFQLQVLEADYLDTNKDTLLIPGTNGRYIKQGIEFDENGKRVGYYLYDTHPGERWGYNINSRFVPAEDVCHIFEDDRPGQTRGVPFGHASMNRLRDFDEFEDAELMKQKVAACFAVMIKENGGTGLPTGQSKTENEPPERLEPGMITKLQPGEDVTVANPPLFNGYGEYSKKVLQGIAAGYEVTYEGLSGDLSNVNFSSGRMGWLEFQRTVHDWQQMIINQLCEKVWGWFILGLQLRGKISESADPDADWTAPRREMIDPTKETKAMTDSVLAGLRSYSEAVREMGGDPEDVLTELAEDMKKFDQNGLILSVDGRQKLREIEAAKPEVVDPDEAQAAQDRLIRAIRGDE